MAIVSSVFVVAPPQVDGRCYVTEKHQRDDDSILEIEYGPVDKIDYQTVANERATQINQDEIEAVQHELEQQQAQEKLDAVFDQAIKDGKISPEEIKKAVGIDVIVDKAIGEIGMELAG